MLCKRKYGMLICLVTTLVFFCNACAPVAGQTGNPDAQTEPTASVQPSSAETSGDTSTYRLYLGADILGNPREGGLTLDEAVQRLYDTAAPQNDLAPGAACAFSFEGIDSEISAACECYLIAFGEDTKDKFTVLRRFAVGEDGSVYEYILSEDAYLPLFEAIAILGNAADMDFYCALDSTGSDAIIVYRDDNSVVQALPYPVRDLYEDFYEPKMEDANFDGHLDVTAVFSAGMPNVFYYLWLWDPDAAQFVEYEPYKDISLPTVHADTRQISSYFHISAMENAISEYEWGDGDLKCVAQVQQIYDIETDMFTLVSYAADENGELIITEELELTEEELLEHYAQ